MGGAISERERNDETLCTTPIIAEVLQGQNSLLKNVKDIVQNNSDAPNDVYFNGQLPFYIAASLKSYDIANYLLEKVNNINHSPDHKTMLEYALEEKNADAVRYLIERGFDVENAIRDNSNFIKEEEAKVIQNLIAEGFDAKTAKEVAESESEKQTISYKISQIENIDIKEEISSLIKYRGQIRKDYLDKSQTETTALLPSSTPEHPITLNPIDKNHKERHNGQTTY